VQFWRKVLLIDDALVLAGDTAKQGGVGGVGRIVFGFGTNDAQVQVQLNGMARDAQIFETRTQKTKLTGTYPTRGCSVEI